VDEAGEVTEDRRYARRMLTHAVPWPTDRKVLLAPIEDGNARVEVNATTIRADPSTGLCVVQLTDEPGRWYSGGDNGDHILLWSWEETEEAAWEDLY
jgi:hypothetical protein